MKLLKLIGLTQETDLGYVDLVAVQKALNGERKVYLREHEREFIYEQYGLTRQQINNLRRDRARNAAKSSWGVNPDGD